MDYTRKKTFYKIFGGVVFVLILVIAGVFIVTTKNYAEDTADTAMLSLSNGWTIQAEVADTSHERIKGLSGRKALARDQGMLFVFDSPGMHGIWMKDMNFSIDILWLDEKYRIIHIVPHASPETYPKVFKPESSASFVLELKAGAASKAGLQEGDRVDIVFQE